mmetsp:Transcript_25815/g.97238  ORF Transcript_25815/g.97238 Transcript_25815/m.97238 type:complete len:248 (+) Transcript_25815:203-946(+)
MATAALELASMAAVAPTAARGPLETGTGKALSGLRPRRPWRRPASPSPLCPSAGSMFSARRCAAVLCADPGAKPAAVAPSIGGAPAAPPPADTAAAAAADAAVGDDDPTGAAFAPAMAPMSMCSRATPPVITTGAAPPERGEPACDAREGDCAGAATPACITPMSSVGADAPDADPRPRPAPTAGDGPRATARISACSRRSSAPLGMPPDVAEPRPSAAGRRPNPTRSNSRCPDALADTTPLACARL